MWGIISYSDFFNLVHFLRPEMKEALLKGQFYAIYAKRRCQWNYMVAFLSMKLYEVMDNAETGVG